MDKIGTRLWGKVGTRPPGKAGQVWARGWARFGQGWDKLGQVDKRTFRIGDLGLRKHEPVMDPWALGLLH